MKKKKKASKKVSGSLQLLPPVESHIVRSFSMKINLGNYQSADFFASQDAYAKPGDEERVSEALYSFCRNQVIKSINRYKGELQEVDKQKSRDVGRDAAQQDAGQSDF